MRERRPLTLTDVTRRTPLRRLGIPVLLVAAGAFQLVPQAASAEISGCRDDPIIALSNGMTMQLDTSIADTVSDVNQISYTVVLPRGVTISSVTHVGDPGLAAKETVQAYAVNRSSVYASDTNVSTSTSGVPVIASMQVSGLGSSITSGQSGQDLVLWVTS